MIQPMENFINFIQDALTPYHAQALIKEKLLQEGFSPLSELEEWSLCEGGKYFIERNGSLLAFTVGNVDNFTYKIAASHLDSPALKLKENPLMENAGGCTLNVERYGGGLWHTFFDRPLKLAGRVVTLENGRVQQTTVQSPFLVSIPSLAVHLNRNANDSFTVNAQTDLPPLLSLTKDESKFFSEIAGDKKVISYDLFAVNAQPPYSFGLNDEFLAAPRIDDLASAYASLEGLLSHAESNGVCMAAFFNNEEIGSHTTNGAGGDFLEKTLRKIAYSFRFDDSEYDKALASSFLLSVDNAHAAHPAHLETTDPTNKTKLGGGVVIKSHAGGAYITDALSSAVVKTVLQRAGVPYQTYFNRSDMRSGSTLGGAVITKCGMHGADIGIAQLGMHSAVEIFCKDDLSHLTLGLTAFFSTNLLFEKDGFLID